MCMFEIRAVPHEYLQCPTNTWPEIISSSVVLCKSASMEEGGGLGQQFPLSASRAI